MFNVLKQEFEELHGADSASTLPNAGVDADEPSNDLERLYRSIHVLAVPRAALCLSGGGIRSASFALGVLQVLARHGLLEQFHYLSTVSGGGYIGSWLSAWRHHECDDKAVVAKLTNRGGYSVARNDRFAEPVELRELRANSNFLTPRLGFLAADAWTGIALYLRNLLLNWFIFGPAFLSLLLIPHLSFSVLIWLNNEFGTVNWTVLIIATLLLLIGLAVSVAGRPARNRPTRHALPERPVAPDRQRFIYFILLPIYLGAGVLATFTAWLPTAPDAMRWGILVANDHDKEVFYSISFAIGFGATLYAAAWLIGFFAGGGHLPELRRIIGRRRDPVSPLAEMICYALSGAAAGAVIALGIAVYQHLSGLAENPQASRFVAFLFHGYSRIYMVVAAGVAWTMTAILTADLFFTGLTSYHRYGDADREWSARAAAYLAAAAIGWLVFAAVVLYGPPAAGIILAMTGGLAGLATLVLGSSAKTAATAARKAAERLSTTTILSIATIVFIGARDPAVQSQPSRARLCCSSSERPGKHRCESRDRHWLFRDPGQRSGARLLLDQHQPVLAACSLSQQAGPSVFGRGAGRPSRPKQDAQQPGPVYWFRRCRQIYRWPRFGCPGGNEGRRRLFPVVNMALNVVASTNLAWQERKAEPFVMTPLACGNPFVNFVPTRFYGGPRDGVTLGTAMAISGAAVSPNQGYHSSPIIGLLLSLFNVRLGWWLGNPRMGPKIYRREGPLLSIRPALDELAGQTTDTGRYIYLSDGGHFENLGLYEMVRRRCHFILVSDAGSDPAGTLEDLGNAVRKIWIDLGIRIGFDRIDVIPRQKPAVDGTYRALGRIHYPEQGAKEGTLVYVKPGFHGSEPPDIRSYAALHKDFPHESTADQWFSESQMESYRSLGSHIVGTMCRGPGTPDQGGQDVQQLKIDEFICLVREHLGSTRSAPSVAEPQAGVRIPARPGPDNL